MLLPSSSATLGGLNRGPSTLINAQVPRRLMPGTNPALGYRPPTTSGLTMFSGPKLNAASPIPTQQPAPAAMPAATPATDTPAGAASSTPVGVPSLPGVSVTGIDPNADLRNSTIAPTNSVNRYDLMSSYLQNYDKTTLPQFQANVRRITQNNAAEGKLGSGMYNTDLGNEQLAAENARNAEFGNLLNDATQGTITDAANNRNELRQERQFQTGQEQQAFDRSRQGIMDTEALKNADFNRNLALGEFGYGQDPSSLIAMLSQMSGQQAAGGASAIGASSANQQYIDLLKQIYAQMGQTPTTEQVPIPSTPQVRG